MPMPTNHLKVQYEFYFRLVQTHPKQLPVGYGIEKITDQRENHAERDKSSHFYPLSI